MGCIVIYIIYMYHFYFEIPDPAFTGIKKGYAMEQAG